MAGWHPQALSLLLSDPRPAISRRVRGNRHEISLQPKRAALTEICCLRFTSGASSLGPLSLGGRQKLGLGEQVIRRKCHGFGGVYHCLITPWAVGAFNESILMAH